MKALGPFRIPCLMHVFHLAFPELYCLIITQQSNKCNVFLSLVSCSRKCTKFENEVVRILPVQSLTETRIVSEMFLEVVPVMYNSSLQRFEN